MITVLDDGSTVTTMLANPTVKVALLELLGVFLYKEFA